jgi:hypothetical protein
MTRLIGWVLAASVALTLSATIRAEVALNSVRVVAKDAEALGKFYAAAFGLKETNRLAYHIELIQPAAR